MGSLEQHDTSLDLLTAQAADRVAERAVKEGVDFARTANRIVFPASADVEVIPGAQGMIGVVRKGIAFASVIEGEEIDRPAK